MDFSYLILLAFECIKNIYSREPKNTIYWHGQIKKKTFELFANPVTLRLNQ